MRRAIHLVLITTIAIGAYYAWQTGRERARLQAQYDRLVRVVGSLGQADLTRPQILALETGEPLHFAWRLSVPPRYRVSARSQSGGGSSSWSGSATDVIARVRLREDPRSGLIQVYASYAGGSSLMSLGDRSVAELLRRHGDRLRIEQIGRGQPTALAIGQPSVLLRLSWPDDLQDEVRNSLSRGYRDGMVPTLYALELTLTPDPASTPSP